jgi:hypothetical protein
MTRSTSMTTCENSSDARRSSHRGHLSGASLELPEGQAVCHRWAGFTCLRPRPGGRRRLLVRRGRRLILRQRPSGCFGANGAWAACATTADNLICWLATLGLKISRALVGNSSDSSGPEPAATEIVCGLPDDL